MTQQGILIVISGPSGTGKGTICKELLRSDLNLHYSISATTRAPRAGETDGVNYWFLAREQFETMRDQGELLECAEVYGNYYGTPRKFVANLLESGKDVVLEIDIQGALQIKEKFPQGVFIYIIPPSFDELAERIQKRGTDSHEVIQKRLNCVSRELEKAYNYHYVVVNDIVEKAVHKIQAILVAEKCRIERNSGLIRNICECGCVDAGEGGVS